VAPPYRPSRKRPVDPVGAGRAGDYSPVPPYSPPIHGTPSRNSITPGQIGKGVLKATDAATDPVGTAAKLYGKIPVKKASVPKPHSGAGFRDANLAPKAKPKPKAAVAPAVTRKPSPKPKATVLPASHPAQPSSPTPVTKAAVPTVKSTVPKTNRMKPLPATTDRPTGRATAASPRPAAAPPVAAPPSVDAQVAALLAPQYKVLSTQEQQRETALRQFADAMVAQLKGVPGQVQSDYQTAQNAISGYAQTAANGLAAANPNAQTQALLQAIGAPQAQQDAVTAHNNDVFGGGAGVLYAREGMLPAQQTASDQASALLYARSLPAIAALSGIQGLRQFQNQDAVARQQLAAQAPDLTLKLRQQRAQNTQANLDYQLKQAALGPERAGARAQDTAAAVHEQRDADEAADGC
jgi:hypothetical protein